MRQRDTSQQSRFKDAPWFPKNNEICLVGGAGGIGSWLCFFLTKIGFKVNVYDFDLVEDHNLGGQLFQQSDVGKTKVNAIQRIVDDFCGSRISTFNERITSSTPHHYYSFSAFDNLASTFSRCSTSAFWNSDLAASRRLSTSMLRVSFSDRI